MKFPFVCNLEGPCAQNGKLKGHALPQDNLCGKVNIMNIKSKHASLTCSHAWFVWYSTCHCFLLHGITDAGLLSANQTVTFYWPHQTVTYVHANETVRKPVNRNANSVIVIAFNRLRVTHTKHAKGSSRIVMTASPHALWMRRMVRPSINYLITSTTQPNSVSLEAR